MEIRNYEFNQVSGLPVVGATVTVYTATLTHPPVTTVTSGVTNGDGLWSFTGLTDTPKDVKVVANGQTKWYKGMSRHGASTIFFEEPLRFQQVASIASAPGAGASVLGFLTDGEPIFRSGAAGAQTKIATYTGATGVLRATGWGTIQTADIADSQVTSAKIADGTIATADIAANAISQIGFSEGSTLDPTTTSGSYATMQGNGTSSELRVDLTTTGGIILLDFSATMLNNGAGNAIVFAFSLDGGTEFGNNRFTVPIANYYMPASLVYRSTGVSAAAHTWRVRWLTTGGTATAFGASRYFRVIEMKR